VKRGLSAKSNKRNLWHNTIIPYLGFSGSYRTVHIHHNSLKLKYLKLVNYLILHFFNFQKNREKSL
jgi:hypothetical protein